MKQLSCGVIIINSDNKILGCKAYGKGYDGNTHIHDIPKGKIEENETPLQAAIRETWEETGIDLKNIELEDLGFFQYNAKKNLHLFKCHIDIEDLSVLHCDSMFMDKHNRVHPEVDGYKWFNLDEIDDNFYISLVKVLNKILK